MTAVEGRSKWKLVDITPPRRPPVETAIPRTRNSIPGPSRRSSKIPMVVVERTDSEWHTFLERKIAQLLHTQTDSVVIGPLASITSPEDPRFSLAVDHTLLKQDATPQQIDALCDDAIKYGFKVRSFPFSLKVI